MIENINRVQEFQKAIGMKTMESPGLPNNNGIDLRINNIKEEIKNLEDVAYTGKLRQVLRALVDIQNQLHGAILDFGMKDIFEQAAQQVHNGNMSMFCKSTASARESVNRHLDRGIEAYYKKIGDYHVILRASDNMLLKGMHFYEPRLKKLIDLKVSQVAKDNLNQKNLTE